MQENCQHAICDVKLNVQTYRNDNGDVIILIAIDSSNKREKKKQDACTVSSRLNRFAGMPEQWSHVLGDQLILNTKNYVCFCKHAVDNDLRKTSENIWK